MMKKSEEQKNIFVSTFLDCYTVKVPVLSGFCGLFIFCKDLKTLHGGIVFVTLSGIMKDQRMTVPKGLLDVEI